MKSILEMPAFRDIVYFEFLDNAKFDKKQITCLIRIFVIKWLYSYSNFIDVCSWTSEESGLWRIYATPHLIYM